MSVALNPTRSRTGGRRSRGLRQPPAADVPLISVITVVRNGAQHLEQCILSVLAQEFANFEYLVVDGQSSDGSLEIIRTYDDRIDYWLSEPDRGIYDAMNKALDAAAGGWIYFLGADDRLAGPETLVHIAPCLSAELDLVFGSVRYPSGRVVRSSLGPRTLLRNTLHHQGAFYNARLFAGWRYDAALRIVADYELNLLVYRRAGRFLRVKELVACCGDQGVSLSHWETAVAETNAIRKRHVGALGHWLCSALFRLEFGLYRLLALLKQRGAA